MPSPHSAGSARAHVRGIIPDAANRDELDFYRTPPVATRRLLAVETIPGPVWEPACGDGAISEVLLEAGTEVYSSDIVDRGYGTPGVDFLSYLLDERPPTPFRSIVTNPPYTFCEEFAARALGLVAPGGKVAMLCRLLWLEGKKRKTFFESSPLSRVWVFSGRVNVSRRGEDFGDGGKGGMVAFAWFIWEPGYIGEPRLGWI
jgi:hypothetical protein